MVGQQTKTREPLQVETKAGSWFSPKRIVIATVIMLALAGGTVGGVIAGGSEPSVQAPGGVTVGGDRDTAFREAAERYVQMQSQPTPDKEEALRQASERYAALPTDREEAFRQAAERYAAQPTDKEEALRQAAERQAG